MTGERFALFEAWQELLLTVLDRVRARCEKEANNRLSNGEAECDAFKRLADQYKADAAAVRERGSLARAGRDREADAELDPTFAGLLRDWLRESGKRTAEIERIVREVLDEIESERPRGGRLQDILDDQGGE